MFSCEFCEIFKNTFLTEQLRVTAFVKRLLYLAKQILSKNFQIAFVFQTNFTEQTKPLSKLFSNSVINYVKFFFLIVYCSERNVSFDWWVRHFKDIIYAMRNFIFMKIIILTFQSFVRRDEKIKWTYYILIILTFDVSIIL